MKIIIIIIIRNKQKVRSKKTVTELKLKNEVIRRVKQEKTCLDVKGFYLGEVHVVTGLWTAGNATHSLFAGSFTTVSTTTASLDLSLSFSDIRSSSRRFTFCPQRNRKLYQTK